MIAIVSAFTGAATSALRQRNKLVIASKVRDIIVGAFIVIQCRAV